MTIQQLRCFTVMAQMLHYTKAAERLHVSQPSLSYSISELEKELGLPLFERRDNKTCLTAYGREILPYVLVALDKVDAIQVKAYELLDPSVGTVQLGNIYSISFDFVPKTLEMFYADRDNAHITVTFVQGMHRILSDMLMEGSLDLILSGDPTGDTLDSAYIFTQELYVVVPDDHRLANREEITLEDVKDEGIISLGENSNISNHVAACYARFGYEPNFVLNVAECSAMGAFVASNMGIAITPRVPSFDSCNVKILRFAAEERALFGRKVYLQWVKERYLPPAARRLRDFIIEELAGEE